MHIYISPAIWVEQAAAAARTLDCHLGWSGPKLILIERALDGEGFQLWRLNAKAQAPA